MSVIRKRSRSRLFCTMRTTISCSVRKTTQKRRFLSERHIEPEKIERICSIINSVSFSKNRGKKPASLEAEIVQDADRLDAIGAIGIARTFAYGGKHGRDLAASADHFHEKLLLLKDEMNTEAARSIAAQRHAFMVEFLEELAKETEY